MAHGPDSNAAPVVFELRDRPGRLSEVRLVEELGLPGSHDLARSGGVWRLRVDRPDVDRMEYLYEVVDHNGRRATITDPANPNRAGGAFGEKSVREFADYRAPTWLAVAPVTGRERALDIDTADLDASVEATIWSPAALAEDEAVPLLIAHDGPEYADLAGLTHYLGAAIATGALPPMRAALLGPGDRNGWYAANPAYARALCLDVVAALEDFAPMTSRIGVGASLGALAMLHAHRRHPGTFDALFLQSGSFFVPTLDPQESRFAGFPAVTAFVAELTSARDDPAPVPVVLTCGTVEENRANNEAVTDALRRLGYPAHLVLVRDAHNYTAWRDALHPQLTRLIADAAGIRAA